MEFLFASELYNESDSDPPVESEEHSYDEDMIHIDNTIQNICRNLRKGDWTYLGRHPEVFISIYKYFQVFIYKISDTCYNSRDYNASRQTEAQKHFCICCRSV